MKKIILLTIVSISMLNSFAQTIVSGKVSDNKGDGISAASIRIKENGEGINADSSGKFSLSLSGSGKRTLEVSSVGFRTSRQAIELNGTTTQLKITLNPARGELAEVVINAGSFEASDKAKGASLTPIDAVTVAGNGNDLANSLRSLPGSQNVGEKEGLFVRGGTNEEAKQFIDGVLLPNPNFSSVPGILQPARVSPFLFKGILFSTGGYSALYGQALSSALILESVDLPDQSSGSFSIFPPHTSLGYQQLSPNKKSSYGIDMGYSNAKLYNQVVPQRPEYIKDPEYLTTDANLRIKTSKTGMLKFYTNFGQNRIAMRNPDIDSNTLKSSFDLAGKNLYAHLSYREHLGNSWKIDASLAYNYSDDRINNQLLDSNNKVIAIQDTLFGNKNNGSRSLVNFHQEKIVLTKTLPRSMSIRFGVEDIFSADNRSTRIINDEYKQELKDRLTAVFAESDFYILRNLAAKIGARAEYSSLLKDFTLAPRVSLAYRFDDGGQVSLAYGMFYQKPSNYFLVQNPDLNNMRADHYILNYQKKISNRIFRIEGYYKKYHNLVTVDPLPSNKGTGYAKGIELFFRDKRTFKNLDYWVSYTYLDTKRQYMNYPTELEPSYTTPHTLAIALKQFFPALGLSANVSYSLATGRPYYDLKQGSEGKTIIQAQGTTQANNAVNVHLAYLFTMFPKSKNRDFSGVAIGVNNLFGSKQVFGYNFSYNGANKVAITLPAPRYYYVGFFITLGIDRRDDLMDQVL